MRIAMLGAGAMGSLFGAMLTRSRRAEVWLLDIWEEHIKRVRFHGLVVESEGEKTIFKLEATTRPEEVGIADLIIVFVKAYLTTNAVEYGLPMVGKDTMFLSLQNGLGNIDNIEKVVGEGRVIAGVTSQGSTTLGPGRIRHGGKGPTFVGRVGRPIDATVRHIESVFNDSGIPTEGSNKIEKLIWEKLIINAGINAVTAITGLRNGELLHSDETRILLAMIVEEAQQVALQRGIPLEDDLMERVLAVCRSTAQNRSSMLQDMDNARRTEIDFINGAIAKEGATLGTPTPVNAALTYLVKTIEARFRI